MSNTILHSMKSLANNLPESLSLQKALCRLTMEYAGVECHFINGF
ncbi:MULTISPECIES: hypothetical protein [unclassified Calothrix]|nr:MULTISPECIES: hypothetical protein [unclassified Calothrix]